MANNPAMSVGLGELHSTLRNYRAEIQRDVSTNKGHIYYSRPLQKWLLVQRKGDKAKISFHADCPCDQL